jgi:hypothetical protein
MSDDTKSNVAQLGASAKVRARLRLPERGVLVLGILFVVVILGSLFANVYRPSHLAEWTLAAGMVGLLSLIPLWFHLARTIADPEARPGDVNLTTRSGENINVSVPGLTPSLVLQIIREFQHSRADLPLPYGSIPPNVSPADTSQLKTYSDEERRQAGEKLRVSVAEQETAALPRIISILSKPDTERLPEMVVPAVNAKLDQAVLKPNVEQMHDIKQAEVDPDAAGGRPTKDEQTEPEST